MILKKSNQAAVPQVPANPYSEISRAASEPIVIPYGLNFKFNTNATTGGYSRSPYRSSYKKPSGSSSKKDDTLKDINSMLGTPPAMLGSDAGQYMLLQRETTAKLMATLVDPSATYASKLAAIDDLAKLKTYGKVYNTNYNEYNELAKKIDGDIGQAYVINTGTNQVLVYDRDVAQKLAEAGKKYEETEDPDGKLVEQMRKLANELYKPVDIIEAKTAKLKIRDGEEEKTIHRYEPITFSRGMRLWQDELPTSSEAVSFLREALNGAVPKDTINKRINDTRDRIGITVNMTKDGKTLVLGDKKNGTQAGITLSKINDDQTVIEETNITSNRGQLNNALSSLKFEVGPTLKLYAFSDFLRAPDEKIATYIGKDDKNKSKELKLDWNSLEKYVDNYTNITLISALAPLTITKVIKNMNIKKIGTDAQDGNEKDKQYINVSNTKQLLMNSEYTSTFDVRITRGQKDSVASVRVPALGFDIYSAGSNKSLLLYNFDSIIYNILPTGLRLDDNMYFIGENGSNLELSSGKLPSKADVFNVNNPKITRFEGAVLTDKNAVYYKNLPTEIKGTKRTISTEAIKFYDAFAHYIKDNNIDLKKYEKEFREKVKNGEIVVNDNTSYIAAESNYIVNKILPKFLAAPYTKGSNITNKDVFSTVINKIQAGQIQQMPWVKAEVAASVNDKDIRNNLKKYGWEEIEQNEYESHLRAAGVDPSNFSTKSNLMKGSILLPGIGTSELTRAGKSGIFTAKNSALLRTLNDLFNQLQDQQYQGVGGFIAYMYATDPDIQKFKPLEKGNHDVNPNATINNVSVDTQQ